MTGIRGTSHCEYFKSHWLHRTPKRYSMPILFPPRLYTYLRQYFHWEGQSRFINRPQPNAHSLAWKRVSGREVLLCRAWVNSCLPVSLMPALWKRARVFSVPSPTSNELRGQFSGRLITTHQGGAACIDMRIMRLKWSRSTVQKWSLQEKIFYHY